MGVSFGDIGFTRWLLKNVFRIKNVTCSRWWFYFHTLVFETCHILYIPEASAFSLLSVGSSNVSKYKLGLCNGGHFRVKSSSLSLEFIVLLWMALITSQEDLLFSCSARQFNGWNAHSKSSLSPKLELIALWGVTT